MKDICTYIHIHDETKMYGNIVNLYSPTYYSNRTMTFSKTAIHASILNWLRIQ